MRLRSFIFLFVILPVGLGHIMAACQAPPPPPTPTHFVKMHWAESGSKFLAPKMGISVDAEFPPAIPSVLQDFSNLKVAGFLPEPEPQAPTSTFTVYRAVCAMFIPTPGAVLGSGTCADGAEGPLQQLQIVNALQYEDDSPLAGQIWSYCVTETLDGAETPCSTHLAAQIPQ